MGNGFGSYTGGPLNFDVNGYTANTNGISLNNYGCFSRENPSTTNRGTFALPVNVSQTVYGLTVGQKYRLQFFVGAEGVTRP